MGKLTATRVSTVPDVNRMGEALKRPGIDTRIWACQAIVTQIVIDRDHGVVLGVTLLPDEIEEVAKLAPMYAGAGFGFYLPVRVDDEVIVVVPMGMPDFGLVAYPRVWDGADPPPQDVVDNPDDVLLHIRSGQNLRIVAEGDGDLIVDPRGSGRVKLGAETGLSRDAREGDTTTIGGAVLDPTSDLAKLQANLDARYTIGGGAPLTPVGGVINSGSDKVEVK